MRLAEAPLTVVSACAAAAPTGLLPCSVFSALCQAMHEYYHTATANIHKGVEHELRQVCWEWAQVRAEHR